MKLNSFLSFIKSNCLASSNLNAPKLCNTTESLSATMNIASPVSAPIVLTMFSVTSSVKNLAKEDLTPSSFN